MGERSGRPGATESERDAVTESIGPGGGQAQLIAERYGAAGAHRFIQRRLAQRRAARQSAETPADVQAAAEHGTSGAGGALPHLVAIQRSFGRHDVGHVRAHSDAAAAEGARAMGAEAFATGDRVAFAGAPSLHTAAHEAAHVVQQRAGVQLKGGVGEAGDAWERHADAVADRVVAGQSAEALLAAPPGGAVSGLAVQRKPQTQSTTPMPTGAQRRKQGGFVARVADPNRLPVVVTVLPDQLNRHDVPENGALTIPIHYDWSGLDYRYAGELVTTSTPLREVRVSIVTRYGVHARPTDASQYGRGTTAEDQAHRDTTLGFHEGRHGLDFLAYFAANELPRCEVQAGMTRSEVAERMADFKARLREYFDKMREQSVQQTDCVGTPMADSNDPSEPHCEAPSR